MSVPNPNTLSHVISLAQQQSGNNNAAGNEMAQQQSALPHFANSAVVAQAEQTLRQCLEKFKRVLPEDKFSRLEMLVKQLQLREITRDDFDKKYFEIMLPYVTPAALPQRYLTAATIYIPPYRLSQEAKKQFLLYFQVQRDQKYELLKNNPELVQILRQFVVLQRQQQISITETGDSNVVHMDGEQSIGNNGNGVQQPHGSPKKLTIQQQQEAAAAAIVQQQAQAQAQQAIVINQQDSFEIPNRKRQREEVEDAAAALEGAPASKQLKVESISLDELSALKEQVKLLQDQKAALEAEHEKLQSEVTSLKHELQIYKYANVDEMEKMRYDELSTVSETLCQNLNIVNKVLKRKHDEEENDKYGMSCIICYENRKNVIFRPCSHVVQCDCCPVPKECPVCKKKIEMACKIFI